MLNKSRIPLRYPDSEPAREWLANWSASELDSVMQCGLSRAIVLASSLLAGRRPARELVADHLRTGLRQVRAMSTCRDSSNLSATAAGRIPGLRPARELVADLLAICWRAATELDSS